MRIQLLLPFIFVWGLGYAQTIEYKVITTVESIVPGGMGRSRIVENNQEMDYKQFTTTREDGKDRNSNIAVLDNKVNLSALRSTYPITLHGQNLGGPSALQLI